MEYKYQILSNVEPTLLLLELNKAGICGWSLVHVQPIQEIKPGINLNGQPVVTLRYQLIFMKESDEK
jgi:hypothetical protein